jgi:hypothetical protein
MGIMTNPWLAIPLADYEGHMKSAAVQQLDALADLFAEALGLRAPASVAVLGVAGGNGLNRIDSGVTKRIVGLDVNAEYLEIVRERYAELPGLELHCVDLAAVEVSFEPVRMVHAALVFEHAGVGKCLENAVALVAEGGALSVVLQLPSKADANIGSSGFASLKTLGERFALVDPDWLRKTLEGWGFRLGYETRREVVGGKEFWMGIFER